MERIAGLICANYETRGLGVLTEDRTIAALPYGGRYRLIDFPLSNMVNSDIQAVGLITPYKYRSILDHTGAGKAWSLDRKNGGLFILPGSTFGISGSRSRFLMRDLKRNIVFLKRSVADYVVITSVDAAYNMDYRPMIEAHEKSSADVTLLYTEAAADFPEDPGLILGENRVKGFTYGVKKGENAFCACFVIGRRFLLNLLEWYSTLEHLDLMQVLAEELDNVRVLAYRCPVLFQRISGIRDYFRHSMELLNPAARAQLLNPDRPVFTKVQDAPPAKYLNGSRTANSLVATGCVIKGQVKDSILFRNVRVETGALVKNSIIMQSCVIRAGAVVENAIIDRRNEIATDMVLKGSPENVFVLGKKNL